MKTNTAMGLTGRDLACRFFVLYDEFLVLTSSLNISSTSHIEHPNVCLSPVPRMRRYMAQVDKGKVKASPETIKLWGTAGGRALSLISTIYHVLNHLILLDRYLGIGKNMQHIKFEMER